MGYDLHITRAANWIDSKKKPITLNQWKAYVASDPEMALESVAIARVKDLS
ncbi:MAG: hypothetical protein ABSH20_11855 [Tepidisphaeraceae bacterium]